MTYNTPNHVYLKLNSVDFHKIYNLEEVGLGLQFSLFEIVGCIKCKYVLMDVIMES